MESLSKLRQQSGGWVSSGNNIEWLLPMELDWSNRVGLRYSLPSAYEKSQFKVPGEGENQ